MIVPTLRVGMPARTLRVHIDAERRTLHYHAERGNDQAKLAPFAFHQPNAKAAVMPANAIR